MKRGLAHNVSSPQHHRHYPAQRRQLVEAFALKPLPVLAQTLRLQLVEAFTPKTLHPQSLCRIHRLLTDRAADQMLINACAVRMQMPR